MSDSDKNKNLLINFIKVNGTIVQTADQVYTLSTNKIKCFLDYTDFNTNNPDAGINVNKVSLNKWLKKYNLSRNPPADSKILPYIPSTIVSYQSGKERLNYICQITNIIKTSGDDLIFTFETSNVKFNKTNNPAITKIDTVFRQGKFKNIRIDFDPLYDPEYQYNADFSFFLQGDLEITKKDSKYTGSFSLENRFIGYRNWNPFDSDRNQILEVFFNDLIFFISMFKKVLVNNKLQSSFKPTTTIEYAESTNIVQIKDVYVSRDKDNQHRVYFDLDNKIVNFFNDKTHYKSVSKILNKANKGIINDVRMDIDATIIHNKQHPYSLTSHLV